jgi:hypothetical protein
VRFPHWRSQLTVSVVLLAVCFLDARGAERSIEAKVWLEKGLSLDVGAEGAPDAIQAFAAMRRAAQAGDAEAAFNVAVMLDSGRGTARDVADAAVWYARSAVRGERRGAFNLAMLYESGEGVPANIDLARSWYAAANLPAAREHLAKLPRATNRPAHIQAPRPQFPIADATVVDREEVELVWTSELQPEPVRFFVELRRLDGRYSKEFWSGFVDVSSVRLPLPAAAENVAWRVSSVARGSGGYAVSEWSTFALPGATSPLIGSVAPPSPHSEAPANSPDRGRLYPGKLRNTGEQPEMMEGQSGKPLPDVTKLPPAAPLVTTVSGPSQANAPKGEAADISHESKTATLALTSPRPAPESSDSGIPPITGNRSSSVEQVAPSVLLILALPNVTRISDLNKKSIVIAGLDTISLKAVETALTAAGAGDARLTEGKIGDIERLVGGDVSAAVVDFVNPAKARSYPEMSGLHLLRLDVNDPRRHDSSAKLPGF